MREGWEIKKLGDIGKVSMCKRVLKEQTSASGDIPFYKIGTFGKKPDAFISSEIYTEFRKKFSFPKKGDILISASGTIGRRVRYDGKPAYFQDSNIVWIDNDEKQVLNNYLYRFYEICNWKSTKGATISRLYNDNLRQIEIAFPKSLSEQKLIVEILDEAFAAIDKAKANVEKNLQNAKELFESYLQNIFANNADGWNYATVENLVQNKILDKPLDGNHGEIHPTRSDFVKEGVPFIMASGLNNGQVDLANCKFIRKEQAKKLRKGFAHNGDVLLSHKGTIGRAAILKTDYDYVILTPQVTYYRVLDNQKMKNEFLYYYFLSPFFQKQIIEGAEGGATRAYIGITKQLTLQIAYPNTLGEQLEIVRNLKTVEGKTEGLVKLYQKKLDDLEELKMSILQRAFTGELIAKEVTA